MNNTRTGLTAMFLELQKAGYKKCVLLEGTYRINSVDHDYKSITIPTNFTVDMNGCTFKLDTVTGEYYEIKNVNFIDTRTTAIAPDSCENVLIENCTFTRCGNSITPAAVDFEDGYCEMQDIYYRNNKVIEPAGTATVIDCGGFNHVYEDNREHTLAIGLNVMGAAITSSKEQTRNQNIIV